MSLPRRGEVWWCELPEIGRRPVVVLSRDVSIEARRRSILGPCTTIVRGLPTEVELRPGTDPVPHRCAVNLDAVEDAPVALLLDRLGRLDDGRMREICAALSVAVGCP
jgi:mRNA interferase MazF